MLLIALCAGLIVGLARGGRPSSFRVPRSAFALIWIALGLQVAVGRLPVGDVGASLWFEITILSYVAIIAGIALVGYAFLTAIQGRMPRVALALVLVGWVSNTVVIAANHGMPVSATAIEKAGGSSQIDIKRLGVMYKHVPTTSRTVLRPLSDVIATPIAEAVPPLPRLGSAVVSPGDLVLLVGIALLAASWLRAPSRQEVPVKSSAGVVAEA